MEPPEHVSHAGHLIQPSMSRSPQEGDRNGSLRSDTRTCAVLRRRTERRMRKAIRLCPGQSPVLSGVPGGLFGTYIHTYIQPAHTLLT